MLIMEKNFKKEKRFRCGIIYGCESSSGGGKEIFEEEGITIDGGLLHDVKYRAGYREIVTVYYTLILPKMRFELRHFCTGNQNQIPVGLSLRHS